ncbi:MAG: class I SAM-dependent methyltransferase family protein [Candidatus Aenigmarchaeota archaeon]|nr:class I SAM-dependent methyltransferase family protein [Candidatus Aenigmarchaeota archaeon]
MALRERLRGTIPQEKLPLVPTAFDIIGNKDRAVAIIEIPQALKRYQKRIAQALMQQHGNVVSVLAKASPRTGVHRTRKLTLLAGSKKTDVVHAESGCRFLVDPKTSYFSPRESAERLRIVAMIKPQETVMVFFAGVGPFAIVIGKKTHAKQVIGIEINRHAVDHFLRNIRLNKLINTTAVLGDVHEKAQEFAGQCDRVLMPLPESSLDFVADAFTCLKPGGTCHVYCFSTDAEIETKKETIRAAAEEMGRSVTFSFVQHVLPYGPGIWKMRIDVVLKT